MCAAAQAKPRTDRAGDALNVGQEVRRILQRPFHVQHNIADFSFRLAVLGRDVDLALGERFVEAAETSGHVAVHMEKANA